MPAGSSGAGSNSEAIWHFCRVFSCSFHVLSLSRFFAFLPVSPAFRLVAPSAFRRSHKDIDWFWISTSVCWLSLRNSDVDIRYIREALHEDVDVLQGHPSSAFWGIWYKVKQTLSKLFKTEGSWPNFLISTVVSTVVSWPNFIFLDFCKGSAWRLLPLSGFTTLSMEVWRQSFFQMKGTCLQWCVCIYLSLSIYIYM